jgi:hypothetical protein
MSGKATKSEGIAGPVRAIEQHTHRQGWTTRSLVPILAATAAGGLALFHLASAVPSAKAKRPDPSSVLQATAEPAPAQSEIIVYASDLPKSGLSEFDFWDDPASPGGKMIGTPNKGDELDPPPENDPHVTFKVQVQRGVPYRCWIHMKVGAPKGKSRANMLWVQFSDAVDKSAMRYSSRALGVT